MKLGEIRIGETYRTRKWDDLAAEFGTERMPNGLLLVRTPVPFPETYRRICGEPFTVKRMERGGRPGAYFGTVFCCSEEQTEVLEEDGIWTRSIYVTPEMLEKYPIWEIDIDQESFLDLLRN